MTSSFTRLFLTLLLSFAVLPACGSDDDDDNGGGSSSSSSGGAGDCSRYDDIDPVFTSVTSATDNNAFCPDFTPDDLNSDDDDDDDSGCDPVISGSGNACSATINCVETDEDGTETTTDASFTVDGAANTLTGQISVAADLGDQVITCSYTVEGAFEL